MGEQSVSRTHLLRESFGPMQAAARTPQNGRSDRWTPCSQLRLTAPSMQPHGSLFSAGLDQQARPHVPTTGAGLVGLLGGLAVGAPDRMLGPQRMVRTALALAAGRCSETRMHGAGPFLEQAGRAADMPDGRSRETPSQDRSPRGPTSANRTATIRGIRQCKNAGRRCQRSVISQQPPSRKPDFAAA